MHNKAGWDDSEKQIYLRYGEDGIADLIAGAAFMGIGLMMLSDLPFVPVWIVLILVPISWALKRLITIPRLSEEEAAGQTSENWLPVKTLKWAAIAGVFILCGLLLLTAFSQGPLSTFFGPYAYWVIIGLSLVVILVTLGLIYGEFRWTAYALLVLPLLILGALAGIDFPMLLTALGALIFCGGLITASRFVASHPRQGRY